MGNPNKGYFVYEEDLSQEVLDNRGFLSKEWILPENIKHKLINAEKQGLEFDFGIYFDYYGQHNIGREIKTEKRIRAY